MECLDRLDLAARRLWIGITTRLGVRKTGLMKLRHEIRECEYEDVRVMWELLRKGSSDGGDLPMATPQRRRTRQPWSVFRWAPRRLCSSF